MKKNLLFLSFIAWILIGCNQKGGPIQSTSPNGETIITISGEKLWADPWKTTITAKRKGFEEFSAEIELYQNDLTSEDVTVKWESNQFASIAFNQGSEPPLFYLVRITNNAITIGR